MDLYKINGRDSRKDSFIVIVAAALSVIIGLSSGFSLGLYSPRDTIPFSEIKYDKPDTKAIYADIDKCIKMAGGDTGSFELKKAVDEVYEAVESYYTMYVYSNVKYSIDTTDDFYSDELDRLINSDPELQQRLEKLSMALAKSQHSRYFYSMGYIYGGSSTPYYTDNLVKLLQAESGLVRDYAETASMPTINFKGKEQYVSDLIEKYEKDEKTKKEIMQAYYKKYNPLLGEIYVKLVAVRHKISSAQGYSSYITYAYDIKNRDYTPLDSDRYISELKVTMVPLFKRLKKDGFVDYECKKLNEDELVEMLHTAVRDMSIKLSKVYSYMIDNELYDVTVSEKKVSGAFETYLSSYDAPFVVVGADGTEDDLMTFSHEFGHFVDSYINYNNTNELDYCETSSQAMEFLIVNHLTDFPQETVDRITAAKLIGSLETFIWSACYSKFEQQVYELGPSELTLQNVNAIAQRCAVEFGIDEYGFGKSWVTVPHFFQSSFYNISYCISNDIAMQVYGRERDNPGDGVAVYLDLVNSDWTMTYLGNIKRVRLYDPLTAGRCIDSAKLIEDYFYPKAETQSNAASQTEAA